MTDGLLLVGHGSRSAASGDEMGALAKLVAAELPDVVVDVGFLEMSDPPASVVLDRLVGAGCDRVVVLPCMLLGAGHAKSDVPAIVVEGRQRHPNVDVVSGGPLGVARVLVEVLGEGVIGAGGQGAPLLVIARGTSDPDANGDAAKAARLVAEWTGAPFVSTAFTGVTGPSVGEGLAVFEQLGFERFAVVFWFLCTGRLVDRAREEIGAFGRRTGRDIVDAGYIGPDARVAALLAERYRSARAGAVAAQNCDLCAYRAPWPGLEERVGMPVGVGHSHLAAEHLHAGHAHAHVHPS